MAQVLKFSKAFTIALHALMYLYMNKEEFISTQELAEKFDISSAHLSKVLNEFVKLRILKSVRGSRGGFKFVADPSKLTLLRIYEAIEGQIDDVDCLLEEPYCVNRNCLLSQLNREVKKLFRDKLGNLTLDKFTEMSGGLRV